MSESRSRKNKLEIRTDVAGYTKANVDGRVQVQSYVNELKTFESILVKWSNTVARRAAANTPNQVVNLGVDVVWVVR